MPCSHGINNPGILKFYNDNVTGATRLFCFSGLLILVRVFLQESVREQEKSDFRT